MKKLKTASSYDIRIHIREEADLYNPLDPDQKTLTDDVVSYLEKKYQEKNFQDYHLFI